MPPHGFLFSGVAWLLCFHSLCAARTYGVLWESLQRACSCSVLQLYVQLFRAPHTPPLTITTVGEEERSGFSSVSLLCWLCMWCSERLHVKLQYRAGMRMFEDSHKTPLVLATQRDQECSGMARAQLKKKALRRKLRTNSNACEFVISI